MDWLQVDNFRAGQTSALQTNNIAQWNGTSWNANFNTINQVFNGPVYSLRNYSNQLYALPVHLTRLH